MSGTVSLPANVVPVRVRLSRDDVILRIGLFCLITLLAIAVVFPLYTLLSKSLEDIDGKYVGLQNFREYFETPALFSSITNSLTVAICVALIVLVIEFVYGYESAKGLYIGPILEKKSTEEVEEQPQA